MSGLVAALFSATILAACGGSYNGLSSSTPMSVGPSLAVPGTSLPQSLRSQPSFGRSRSLLVRKKAVAYTLLYGFKGYPHDGAYPGAGLLDVSSTLYGTTALGGRKCSFGGHHGCGTVFAITTSGAETVLHRFRGRNGYYPSAGLVDVNGTLDGTTEYGGANREGTVFSTTTSGKETVLHSFPSGSGDGAYPVAGLLSVNSTLYGTTASGGANNKGTVFSITASGTETVLHSFGGSGDGAYPYAGLIIVNGTLYGTTEEGGANCSASSGCGTVFSITPSGTETVLYSFGSGSEDGTYPFAGLINLKGKLYGTTNAGGANCRSASGGCGTVFSITTTGKETVLHSFGTGSEDGDYPVAGLFNVNGTLYGTTLEGGASCCGTVFAVTTSGKETVLHSFPSGSGDGENPYAGLINVNGTLYGTTDAGGANGDGTVFSLTP
jgi:uncharacterized repeat protein (TIGR03803 family)